MNIPGVGEFCWNELATPNVAVAKDFYGKILGWTFSETQVGDMTYTIIHKGKNELGGIWEIPSTQINAIPPHWLAYVTVEALETVLEQAESLGAVVTMPITPVGTHGTFAVIKDPTGAHIALWESVK